MTFTTRPEIVGTFGMAASTHPIATAAGMAILEEGGTAFDAAVAMGLTLQVVQPHLCGLGGDVPIIGFDAASNSSWVLCGQGVSPAAASAEHFAELGLDLVPGTGQLPAVVPGAFGAWMTLLTHHGTLPLRSIMRFAIDAARVGFALPPRAAAAIGMLESTFREHWTSSAEVYLPGGRAPAAGERFTNPQLANTLERLLAEGEAAGSAPAAQAEAARRAFYEGFVAEGIDAFRETPVRDSSGRDHRGLLGGDDVASWSATFEEPARATFRGHEVLKTQAWGQGPVLLQQLMILDGLDLESAAPASADLIHVVVEAAKLAFADREAYYGDAAASEGQGPDVPLDALLSPAYAAERRALITDSAASGLHPGSPDGRTPVLPDAVLGDRGIQAPAGAGVGEPTITKGDTVHLDVVDRWGNVLSVTPSGAWLQSSPIIPGLGVEPAHPRPDVLAAAGTAQLTRAPQAPAHHLEPRDAAARRPPRAVVRHARRRRPGPVAGAVPDQPPRARPRSSGGDRGAAVEHEPLPVVIRSARLARSRGRARGAGRPGREGGARAPRTHRRRRARVAPRPYHGRGHPPRRHAARRVRPDAAWSAGPRVAERPPALPQKMSDR